MSFAPGDILYNQYNFDPVVFAWNMDPKTMPGRSPYEVFGNNPVLYVDPDGDVIKFMGYRDGTKAPMSDEVAEKMWEEMKDFIHMRGMGKYLDRLEESETTYEVYFVNGLASNNFKSYHDKETGEPSSTSNPFFNLNPFKGGTTYNNYRMSPIELIMHEIGHGWRYDINPVKSYCDGFLPDINYDTYGELLNTTTIEQEAAIKLGTKDKYDKLPTRTDHKMKDVYLLKTWQPGWYYNGNNGKENKVKSTKTSKDVLTPYNTNDKSQPEHSNENSKIKVSYD